MTQLQQKVTLPAAMAQKLDVVRRRTLRVRVGTAIVAAVGVLLAAMAVAMLVDWLATLYDFRWRALLTYSAWTTAGVTLLAWALAAWRHTRGVDQMATKVDHEIPELEERWSTVTSLSANGRGSTNGQTAEVHPAMFQQVSTEAQKLTPRVEADRVVPLDGLIRALLFLTAITTILGVAVIFDGQRTSVLLKRFWQPHVAISATELIDVTDKKVIGRGESLEITANLVGLPVEQASLLLEPKAGDPKTITLVPRGDGQDRLTHRLRSVKEPLRYRLRAGDGQTPWYEIIVADRPQLKNVRLTLTPPTYTRKEPKVINKLPRRITVLEGSHIEIAFKPKQSLQTLQLKLGADLTEQLTADDQGWYRWETTLAKSFSFQPLLTEEHGLTNLRPPTCEIKCRPDKPPLVKILTPNSEMAVRPDETIPVTFVASDDVGVHHAELVVYDESQKIDGKPRILDRIPIPLGEQQGAVKVKATVELDLSKYKTTDGSELSFSIRVREDRGQQMFADSQNTTSAAPQLAQNTPPSSSDQQLAQEGQQGAPQPASQSPSGDSEQEATANSPTQAADNKIVADAADTVEKKMSEHETLASQNKASADPKSAQEPLTNSQQAGSAQDPLSAQASNAGQADQQNGQDSQNAKNANAASGEAQTMQNAGDGKSSAQQAATSKPSGGQQAAMKDEAADEAADTEAQTAESKPATSTPTEQLAASEVKPTAENKTSATAKPGEPTTPTESTEASRTTATGRQSLKTASSQQPQETADETAESEKDSAEKDPTDKNPTEKDRASESAASAADPQNSPNKPSNNKPSNNERMNQQPNKPDEQAMAQDPKAQDSAAQNSAAQKSSNANNSPSSKPQSSKPQSSSPQAAGNPMTKRELDVPQAQSSNSQRMKLKIDEWAGSFDGQQRQKLEISIAPRLEELDQALEKAQLLSRSVLDDADAGQSWASKHDRDIQRSDQQIEAAIKVVEALEDQTYDTPYAFIGLQLVDISQAHIGPARRDFWKSLQTDGDARVEAVRNGWQHTTRARELLVLLTERFERTKSEYKVADSVEKIKKMYRIYIEDSMALLRPPSDGGRYKRKIAEFDLDDEYLARLKEVREMRNEMRAELARILADDPRLLRRYLDAQRNRQSVLRNQLDRLIEKQSDLNRETRAWTVAEEDKRPQLAAILLGRHIESAQDLAIAAAELHDRFETWSPLGKEVEDAEFLATAKVLQEIATATQELSADGLNYVAQSTRAKKVAEQAESATVEDETAENPFDADQAAEQISGDAQQLYERFTELEVLLRQIGSRQGQAEIANFATSRLLETRRLVEQTSAWIRQLKQQRAGNYHRSAEVGQYRLAMKTDALAGKLANLEQTLAGLFQRGDGMLPEAMAEKARSLLATLDEQAAPNQLAAVYALRRNQMPRATSRQASALAALELAGKLYDEMVEESIKELDKLPVEDPLTAMLRDPTLDELLARLEQEAPIDEILGIPARPTNLRIISDWLRSGGDNALNMGGNNRMMMNQMRRQQKMRQRQLDKAYQRAVARALKETDAEDLIKDMPKLARETTDWNRLASELEDDVRQGRDKAPPERYRRAIKQYFRQISASEKESE